MKNKCIELLIIILCFFILGYGLLNNTDMCLSITTGFNIWYKKVFPSLFPSILITNILLNNNTYILKIIKIIGIKWYVFFLSLVSGSINNALIIKNLYLNNIIDLNDSNKLLMFSYFNSPTFLIAMLSQVFIFRDVIVIIICSYLSNLIICLFNKIRYNNINNNSLNNNLSSLINNTINVLLNILGIICFFVLVSSIIINIFNLDIFLKLVVKGFLEITQGLDYLNFINISYFIKSIIALIIINFGGVSIHIQIKSILSDTPISYKYFLIGRLISIIFSIVLYLIIWAFIFV